MKSVLLISSIFLAALGGWGETVAAAASSPAFGFVPSGSAVASASSSGFGYVPVGGVASSSSSSVAFSYVPVGQAVVSASSEPFQYSLSGPDPISPNTGIDVLDPVWLSRTDVPYSIYDYIGKYDGNKHVIDAAAIRRAYAFMPNAQVLFATSSNGVYGVEMPVFEDVVATCIWYRVSIPGYDDAYHPVKMLITPADLDPASDPGAEPDPGTGLLPWDYVGVYDGLPHTVDTTALLAAYEGKFGVNAPAVAFALSPDGDFAADAPVWTDVVTTSFWYRVSAGNYNAVIHPCSVSITNRPVTLTSETRLDIPYDGEPHSCPGIEEGGLGFAAGEGVTTLNWTTVTYVSEGIVDNAFDYAPLPGTDLANYAVSVVTGKLAVVAAAVAKTGEFVSYDLERDLNIKIPAHSATEDKVTVEIEGLPKGLKLVAKNVSRHVVYAIEGVPTESVDFGRSSMLARVVVTYADKSKGRSESLQVVSMQIESPTPKSIPSGVVGIDYVCSLTDVWPEIDAKWTVKGLPSGLKYTPKLITKKNRDGSIVTNARPFTVYGTPKKAGSYLITATHNTAIASSAAKETKTVTLEIWAKDDECQYRYVNQAYVSLPSRGYFVGADAVSASGLPKGIKFASKANKSGTVVAHTFYGKPTKAGVYLVTIKRKTSGKAGIVKDSFLWKVTPGENPGVMDLIDWKVENNAVKIRQGADLETWTIRPPADATVTISGLPKGLSAKKDKKTGRISISGIPTKAGVFAITVKTVLNGQTVVERMIVQVEANPWSGYWVAVQPEESDAMMFTAQVTVSENGKTSMKLSECVATENAKGVSSMSIVKTSVLAKSLDTDGCACSLVLPRKAKVSSDADRQCRLDFENRQILIEGVKVAELLRADEVDLDDGIADLVLETGKPGQADLYATLSVSYSAKKKAFSVKGKLADGTKINRKLKALSLSDFGLEDEFLLEPVMLINKSKDVVWICLNVDGDWCCVRQNGKLLPIGKDGFSPSD